MNAVKEYLTSAVFAICAAGICGMLSFDEKLGKYVRFTVSLCVLAAILLPLRPTLVYLKDMSYDINELENIIDDKLGEYSGKVSSSLTEHSLEILKSAIKERLRADLGIPEHECELLMELKEDASVVEKITVILYGYSVWKDPDEIKSYMYSLVECECEVALG